MKVVRSIFNRDTFPCPNRNYQLITVYDKLRQKGMSIEPSTGKKMLNVEFPAGWELLEWQENTESHKEVYLRDGNSEMISRFIENKGGFFTGYMVEGQEAKQCVKRRLNKFEK